MEFFPKKKIILEELIRKTFRLNEVTPYGNIITQEGKKGWAVVNAHINIRRVYAHIFFCSFTSPEIILQPSAE